MMNKELYNSLLDFYTETLQSDHIKDLVIKYNDKYYNNIQNINIKVIQFETILKTIKNNNNFIFPDSFEEYESDNSKYTHITELIDELIESFRIIDRIKLDSREVFEEMKSIIDLLKVQELIEIDDKNIITVKYPMVEVQKRFAVNNLGELFFERLQEIKKKKYQESDCSQIKFNMIDIVFFLMNKNISWEEYQAKYRLLDIYSNIYLSIILMREKTLKRLFNMIDKLIALSEVFLDYEGTRIFYIKTIREGTFYSILIAPIGYKYPRERSRVEHDKSRELFLKPNVSIDTKIYNIIDWNFILRGMKDLSISGEFIDEIIILLNMSKEVEERLSKVFSFKALLDNRYNLIPIPKELYEREIKPRIKNDPIKKMIGPNINMSLYLELKLVDDKLLYLKHIFTDEKILLDDLSSHNSFLNKDNIYYLLEYNKILHKILRINEFIGRCKNIYNKL